MRILLKPSRTARIMTGDFVKRRLVYSFFCTHKKLTNFTVNTYNIFGGAMDFYSGQCCTACGYILPTQQENKDESNTRG